MIRYDSFVFDFNTVIWIKLFLISTQIYNRKLKVMGNILEKKSLLFWVNNKHFIL